ncbi:MAG: peptidylprolyl isomerase [Bacilli bacterium]|jgi:foldase protein PrsA
MNKKIVLISLGVLFVFIMGIIIGRSWNKVPKLKDSQEVVVSIKGKKITTNELYNLMKERHASNILIELIDKSILNKKYKTDKDLDEEIEKEINYIKEQTGDDFLKAIEQQWGFHSQKELYEFIEITLKRNLAVEDYVKETIKDKEIEAYYEEEIDGDVKVSHILIKPKITEEMEEEERKEKDEEALKLAKEIIKKLDNGEDFAKLAKKYSDDESNASDGGKLDWFNHGKMDPSFEEEAYSLAKGKYSKEPIKSYYGYHIVLKEDQKKKPTLKKVKEEILSNLAEEKLATDPTLPHLALDKLRKENKLTIHDSLLLKQYKRLIKELTKKE